MYGILEGASFYHAKLRGCHVIRSSIRNANFDGADLLEANFSDCDLAGSSFRNAKCKEAVFSRANLVGCDFHGANLLSASLSGAKLDKTTDFRGANLINADCKEYRDSEGTLLSAATDFRQATYDETTQFGEDPLLEQLDVLRAAQYVLRETDLSETPSSSQLAQMLQALEEDLKQRYRPRAYLEFLPMLPKADQDLLLKAISEGYSYRKEVEPYDNREL